MFQKGLKVMMIIGTLVLVGLLTTLIIRECQSEKADKAQIEVVK